MLKQPKFKIGHIVALQIFTGVEYCGPVMAISGIVVLGNGLYDYICTYQNCGAIQRVELNESEIKLIEKQTADKLIEKQTADKLIEITLAKVEEQENG